MRSLRLNSAYGVSKTLARISYRTAQALLRNHYVRALLGFAKLLILWWAQQDSNLRLPPCEGGTLPLSYAPLISQQKTTEALRRTVLSKNTIYNHYGLLERS
jgi:hypothetical protein